MVMYYIDYDNLPPSCHFLRLGKSGLNYLHKYSNTMYGRRTMLAKRTRHRGTCCGRFIFFRGNHQSQWEGLLGESDVIETSWFNLKVIAKKNRGETEREITRLLSAISWSAGTYAQLWGIKTGVDGRRKALVCESMPLMMEYSGSVGKKELVKYQGLYETVAHIIDHVGENDHGKSRIEVSKLLDAHTNTVPEFAIVEEESKSCPLMVGAFACGLKVCMYLPLFHVSSGSEIALSNVENAYNVYSDFIKGINKTRKLKVFDQVAFGSKLYAKFPQLVAEKKTRKSKSTPKFTKPPLSNESRKRGVSDGGKPEASRKRQKPATSSSGQTSSSPLAPLTAMDDLLTVKVRLPGKSFKKKVIPYNSASFLTIQEAVEECVGVERGVYTMSYYDEEGDSSALECDEEMKDALKCLKELNNNVLKIEVERVNN